MVKKKEGEKREDGGKGDGGKAGGWGNPGADLRNN